MLSQRQEFKAGFIARCIDAGITEPVDMQKLAQEAVDDLQSGEKQAFWGGLKDMAMLTAGGLIAGPPIVGAGLGYAASRMGDVDDTDVDEVKRQEVIDELRRQTARMRSSRATAGQFANGR